MISRSDFKVQREPGSYPCTEVTRVSLLLQSSWITSTWEIRDDKAFDAQKLIEDGLIEECMRHLYGAIEEGIYSLMRKVFRANPPSQEELASISADFDKLLKLCKLQQSDEAGVSKDDV